MLVIVRHGRTAANAAGLLQGQMDLPLDDVGRAQAAAAGAMLRGLGLLDSTTRFVSSPLQRAAQTAAIVANGASVEIDPRWIELDYGSLDGRPISEVAAEVWDKWRLDLDFVPAPGGESLRELGVRVRAACSDLVEAARDATVVVATHVSPLKAAVGWALGVDDAPVWRMFVAPGSVTRVAIQHAPVLVSFNEVPPPLVVGD